MISRGSLVPFEVHVRTCIQAGDSSHKNTWGNHCVFLGNCCCVLACACSVVSLLRRTSHRDAREDSSKRQQTKTTIGVKICICPFARPVFEIADLGRNVIPHLLPRFRAKKCDRQYSRRQHICPISGPKTGTKI